MTDELMRLADGLSPLQSELFTGSSQSWGSWMFEVGADLCAKGLGRRANGSIYFDTPLANELIRFLRAKSEEGSGK